MIKKRRQQKEIVSIREKYSKGELSKEILKGLAVGGLIIASFALPGLPQVFSLFGAKDARSRYRIKRSIESMEKQKLIKIYKKDGKEVVEIINGGKKKILKYKLDDMKIIRPKKWDRHWRIIAFDIPEKHKLARTSLSNKLTEMEIYPLQKSFFICPFDCKNEVDFIGEFFNVRKYIHYFMQGK